MSDVPILKVGRTEQGFVIRIEGRGTMRESPAFRTFVRQTLNGGRGVLTLDLNACEYLDSTFLGCLVALHKEFSHLPPPRFVVAASPETRQRLLALTHLDRVLLLVGEAPEFTGTWFDISAEEVAKHEFGHHVMQCHRQLADLGGPNSGAFARIADQLARELAEEKAKS